MLALIGYGLLGVVIAIGVVALLVLVLPGDHLGAAPRDVVPAGLPSRPEIDGDDVARVRLPVTLRGYRMVDTDAVLDRLALELERRDREIDDLRRSAGLPARANSAPLFAEGDSFAVGPGTLPGDDEVLAGSAADVGDADFGEADFGDADFGDAGFGDANFGEAGLGEDFGDEDDAPSRPTAADPPPEAAADRAGPAR